MRAPSDRAAASRVVSANRRAFSYAGYVAMSDRHGIVKTNGRRQVCTKTVIVCPMFRGRHATSIENDALRVTVLHEGGHIAEILDKRTGINPLWIPPWLSIEPSAYDPVRHPEYGGGADASLLAGIMGHNLCLDIFGGPSADEAAAGLPAHGEASTARFAVDSDGKVLALNAVLPAAQLRVDRRIVLADRVVHVHESVENLSAVDRPIGWTQHVTIGPPFLEKGATELRVSATQSRVFEGPFGPNDTLVPGADFDWPVARLVSGGFEDLRVCTAAGRSSAYTMHLMDPARDDAFFVAFSPAAALAFGYTWRRADFPWMGIWEENNSRTSAPWNGRTLTRGLEFGVSPMPETRRQMIERGRLFDSPTFRWIPARQRVDAEYSAILRPAEKMPEVL